MLARTYPRFSHIYWLFFPPPPLPTLMWSHSVSFILQSAYSLVLFLSRRLRGDRALPLPRAPLISSLCRTRSVSSFLSLSLSHTHSSVCVRIVWVCANGRESVRLAGGGLRGLAARCVQCERPGREEGEELQQAGVRGEQRWSAWVFLF